MTVCSLNASVCCQSRLTRSDSTKSSDWFCSIRSRMCETISVFVPRPEKRLSNWNAVTAFLKSWSTGVRKKSRYSTVPSARQWRRLTSPSPISLAAWTFSEKLS